VAQFSSCKKTSTSEKGALTPQELVIEDVKVNVFLTIQLPGELMTHRHHRLVKIEQ